MSDDCTEPVTYVANADALIAEMEAEYHEYRMRCHCGEKTEDDEEIYESEYDDTINP